MGQINFIGLLVFPHKDRSRRMCVRGARGSVVAFSLNPKLSITFWQQFGEMMGVKTDHFSDSRGVNLVSTPASKEKSKSAASRSRLNPPGPPQPPHRKTLYWQDLM
ncbi:unnamed protein product [Tetraodon nigroviridis]|uniref:(spotted green pufferfish) hypothetical protein n=1 Tax=Tetraodon nigroviridis TaxID=99883 RepID=Q4SKX1_TETNG|nr:unnamed protein product [Tetraodon nigroviridis]